ncbi:hypothetical protein M9Q32_37405, partial [Bradyrhizobium denitrificans]|nr:hypothetical protein [Bradyrhizobium denitrificans]
HRLYQPDRDGAKSSLTLSIFSGEDHRAFEAIGLRVVLDRSGECLCLEGGVNICFRIAKWRRYAGRPARWTIMRRSRSQQGWVVAMRLGEDNQRIRDYLLVPSSSIVSNGRLFWVSENPRKAMKIERFDTFQELSRSLLYRVRKTLRSRAQRSRLSER